MTDGTTNFVHGFPHACISLGLIVNKRPVLGVIYNPFLDQLYTGLKGHGAFLSSPHSAVPALAAPRRLPLARPRPLPSLGQALIGIEWGSDRSKEMVDKKGDSFKLLAGNPAEGVVGGKMAHSLRSYGSAALNYAMVAQGGLDMYWCVLVFLRVWPPAGPNVYCTRNPGRSDAGTSACSLRQEYTGNSQLGRFVF